MKYRFRPSPRRLPDQIKESRRHRLVCRGRNTLQKSKKENETIRFFSLFDLHSLPAPKPKKKARPFARAYAKLIAVLRLVARATRTYASQLVGDYKHLWHAWLARRSARSKKASSLIPILSGFLCATLVVSLFSAAGILFGLLAPYARSYIGVTIPNFVGRDAHELLNQLESPHLNLIIQYKTNPDVAAGTVITQLPRAGVERRIYEKDGYCNVTLTVSRPNPSYVLEDLVGVEQRDALLALRNKSLSVTVHEIESSAVPVGCVVKTEPTAGSTVSGGAHVTLHVNRAKQDTRYSLPNLVGMGESDAAFHLRSAGFTVKNIRYTASSAPLGSVLSQDPPAYTQAAYGSAVSLVVSIGAHTDELTVPDLFGLSLKEASALLAQYGLSAQTVYTVPSPAEQGTVLRQVPASGTALFGINRQITLYVSS